VLLYDSSLSGNCYKVRLLFAQLGLPYERREIDVFDRSERATILGALNPAQRVPTLVLDDGRALAESGAILHYFAEGTPLLPAERFERAQVLQWIFFEQYSHEPYIAVVRFWAHAGLEPGPKELEAKRRGGSCSCRRSARATAAPCCASRPSGGRWTRSSTPRSHAAATIRGSSSATTCSRRCCWRRTRTAPA
jgi:glutathione S-transferase